jgi:hypothetical protein
VLAASQLGRALYSDMYAAPARPGNTARFVFLDHRALTRTTTGSTPRMDASPCFAPRPAATHTTVTSPPRDARSLIQTSSGGRCETLAIVAEREHRRYGDDVPAPDDTQACHLAGLVASDA